MDPGSAAHQLVGAVFNGRWKLMKLVGEGGMGAVYEAHSLANEGTRAIKVLHPEFTSEEQVLSRFFAEAQAARMLQHLNVAQIFEATRAEDGTPYLVMEFLRGMPLSGLMKPGQPMPPQQAAPIVYGVLQALAIAHPRGVVHRDLKPDNLFLVPDSTGNHVVKVLDFGIAKVMDAAGGMGSKTKTGVLLGTPGYMSPEQIKNSKGVDARSDLWSVGVILYEMLTGREAFPADNEFTRLTLVLTQEITPIGQVNPGLSSWDGFFQRALSKDPVGRFQSAQEMAQALMEMVQSNKSQSAQGREWGTVVLSIPQPPNHGQGPQTQSYGTPQPLQPLQPFQGVQPHRGSYPDGPMNQQRASASPPSVQAMSVHALSAHGASHGTSAMQVPVRPASMPPPGGPHQPSGPTTHVSGMRPPGTPSHVGAATPEVVLMRAPPVGFPLWVLLSVGLAGLVVGFVVGAVAF